MARDRGSTIWKNMRSVPQPSTSAASSKSLGSSWKKLFITITVHAPQALGRILANQLLIRPRLRMLMKLGIMPAPKSMVNITSRLITLPPTRSSLESM